MSSPPLLRLAASGGYFALFLLFSLFHTSSLPYLQPESTFSGPLRQSAAGLEERTGVDGKKTLTLSLQQSGPFFLLLYLCGLGKVGCLFLTSWLPS